MFLAGVCAFTAGGLLFAMPSAPGSRGALRPRSLSEAPTFFTDAKVTETPGVVTGRMPQSLFVGICLGLLVALTSSAAPAQATSARGILEYLPTADIYKNRDGSKPQRNFADVDPDLYELKGKADMKADAKKRFKDYKKTVDASEAAAKALMKPNYGRASTGAGNYKQYKMDLAYPIKAIPDRDDGTYDFGPRAPPPQKPGLGGGYSALLPISGGFRNEAEKTRVQEEYNWFITKPTKYGNFYSASAPYKYSEQPRFREKMYGEYGQKAADYENAKEAAAKKK